MALIRNTFLKWIHFEKSSDQVSDKPVRLSCLQTMIMHVMFQDNRPRAAKETSYFVFVRIPRTRANAPTL